MLYKLKLLFVMARKFIYKRTHEKHVRTEMREISKESENKIKNRENMDSRFDKLAEIMDNGDKKMPKRKVKVEKKDKGLFERTEDSTILITEDNKLMLND